MSTVDLTDRFYKHFCLLKLTFRLKLLLVCINDLDDNIKSNVLEFANDTKVFRRVNNDGDKQHLQNDINKLVKQSEKQQMLFNFGNCKCPHTGHGNLGVNYKIEDYKPYDKY